MVIYVSMLRGINVGGQRKVPMKELRACYESLGLSNVSTYIQSGNVMFASDEHSAPSLVGAIEAEVKERFGFTVVAVLRTEREMMKIIERNPFAKGDRDKSYVTFLSAKPSRIPIEEIDAVKAPSEEYSISGGEVYLLLPNGYGRTKLSNSFMESKLGVSATTRNWNTVMALRNLAGH